MRQDGLDEGSRADGVLPVYLEADDSGFIRRRSHINAAENPVPLRLPASAPPGLLTLSP